VDSSVGRLVRNMVVYAVVLRQGGREENFRLESRPDIQCLRADNALHSRFRSKISHQKAEPHLRELGADMARGHRGHPTQNRN
jgi:hypothetical protein